MGYNASATFEGTEFVGCSSGDRGGAFHVEDAARLQMRQCKVQACTTNDVGGGLYLRDTAVARLADCNITDCKSGTDGGGLSAYYNTSVSLYGCRFVHNKAARHGAGIEISGVNFDAQGLWLFNNVAKENGGGIATSAEAHLRISQCIISGNSAHAGGGIWLGDTSIVRLSGTRVSGNSARAYGGGVVLESSNFVRSQIEAATSGNQAKSEADISVWPTTITCLNDSTVENFVSRLNSEEGVVNVLLEVTGAQGLPSKGVVVVASLGGVNLKEQASGRDGMAFLPVKLRKPYGELLGCSHSLAPTAAKAVCSSLAEYSRTI
jgi:hypothetical protein